jgi:hypothetical protein
MAFRLMRQYFYAGRARLYVGRRTDGFMKSAGKLVIYQSARLNRMTGRLTSGVFDGGSLRWPRTILTCFNYCRGSNDRSSLTPRPSGVYFRPVGSANNY